MVYKCKVKVWNLITLDHTVSYDYETLWNMDPGCDTHFSVGSLYVQCKIWVIDTRKCYHIGPSSHFNFKGLFKDCFHVLSKCWAQSQYSLFKSGESCLRSRLPGDAEEERAPVWVVFGCREIGNRSWDFYTLTLEEGPYCALYLHWTSTAKCMETRAKNTIILYK